MGKRLNPYSRLLNEIREYMRDLRYRHTKIMWRYSKNTLGDGWDLNQLYERVAAAGQLGYEVKLIASDKGLEVIYQKEVPNIPWEWRD
jgi:hypothetical protein